MGKLASSISDVIHMVSINSGVFRLSRVVRLEGDLAVMDRGTMDIRIRGLSLRKWIVCDQVGIISRAVIGRISFIIC